jgi:NAD(P)-dependent dehydrogenase (short-subunit alcohol dehydrogenase family)
VQIRLNPVTLITGAGSGVGAGCAHDLARKSHGGLVLADQDEAALALVADELDAAGASPERVSTMAFDVRDPDRWKQAIEFILSQYGRLDWAVVNVSAPPPPPADTDLVEWRRIVPKSLDGALVTLRALMPILRKNIQGGAILVTAPAEALNTEANGGARANLVQVIQAAAAEGESDKIRINAIAPSGAETAWADAPVFQDLVRETGSEVAASDRIANLKPPVARYASTGDLKRLILLLMADETPISGATLIVDGGNTL